MHSFGIQDELFIRGDVPMTKREVRMALLQEGRLTKTSNVLDIGAGTGSISVEAALYATEGRVYAVERNSEGIQLIQANKEAFQLENIQIIEGTAPDALAGLPMMDTIFIGGSGGHFGSILDRVEDLLCTDGRLVIPAVTVETAMESIHELRDRGYAYDAYLLQVSRLERRGRYHMMSPLSPVYIVHASKVGA